MIEKIILKQVANQSSKIAEIYQQRVWETHLESINKLKQANSYKDLLTDGDFIKFAKDSIDFFKNINSQIALFDMYGNKFITSKSLKIEEREYYEDDSVYDIIFSKIDRYFLKELMSGNPVKDCYEGRTRHVLIPKALITNDKKQQRRASLIISYTPIINKNFDGNLIDGVIEINTDVTEQWQNITALEKRVFIVFIIIFSIFFAVIMYNTNYAQRIINRQFETNRALEEAKLKAESESSAKTEFLANVSHELRTPLNAIIGFSEIMLSETYSKIENQQYKEYIQDINNSGKHLLSVINDILDFSKASADKLKVEHVELDLNKLASGSMRFVKPRADEAGVKLIENFPKEHIIIKADPKRLKQALLNLISNSVKFTPENGSITLTIIKNEIDRLVYIKVIDTGIGMEEKDIPKALSTFGQVDNTLSRKYEGTGLGLPLTKKLIELMLGKFDIQSKVGVGTTVTLTFKYDEEISL